MKRFQLRQGEPADEAAYLDRLGKCLVGWLPESQVLEVLSDYREQFQVGRERGRTDAEITAAMGAPGDVARGLLAEEPSAKTAGLRQTGLWAPADRAVGGGAGAVLRLSVDQSERLRLPVRGGALSPAGVVGAVPAAAGRGAGGAGETVPQRADGLAGAGVLRPLWTGAGV